MVIKPDKTLQIKRWEVQVLMLLAQEPNHPEAQEVFNEYKDKFGSDALEVAKQILSNNTINKVDSIINTARAFLSAGSARNK